MIQGGAPGYYISRLRREELPITKALVLQNRER